MDKLIYDALQAEDMRQKNNIELIASENYTSSDVMALQGSILTNKYAEGYPDRRYYGGCQNIDTIESLAQKYACQLFKAKYANVQPHSGAQANMAVQFALLRPGDTIMGMSLSAGGHLTHGAKPTFSGKYYNSVQYGVDAETGLIDYDKLEDFIVENKPRLFIAGASAYPREIDFAKLRTIIDKANDRIKTSILQDQTIMDEDLLSYVESNYCYFMVDMAHIAGLVASGLHMSPIPYADVVTTTTHKTLRGPRGGLILTNSEELMTKINKAVFPGIQGGPLEHVIAAKAQCLYEALQPEFKTYQQQVLKNIKALSLRLEQYGIHSLTGGTDNHLILIDVYNSLGITGRAAEKILDQIHITVNKNAIPNDKLKPSEASGIRLGAPAMTTRGFKEPEFELIGDIIYAALTQSGNPIKMKQLENKVLSLTSKFPCPEYHLPNMTSSITNVTPNDVNTAMQRKFNEHAKLLDELHKLYVTKNHDYGDSVHDTYNKYGLTSFLVRIEDKLNRVRTLNEKKALVNDEKIEDTLLDMANYAILAVLELHDTEGDQGESN